MTRKKLSVRPNSEPGSLTPREYGGLQAAYEHFNAELFDGSLPDVFIVLARKAHSKGHFSPDRYVEREGGRKHHELNLNPDTFFNRTDEEVCSTLAHEMCHAWQKVHGKMPSNGYHDRQWAAKMKEIGLYPSNTGFPGGKETGAKMTHYILPDGAFTQSFARLAAGGWKLNLQSAAYARHEASKASSKVKFTCRSCGQNAWGKPDLAVDCRHCKNAMRSAEQLAALSASLSAALSAAGEEAAVFQIGR